MERVRDEVCRAGAMPMSAKSHPGLKVLVVGAARGNSMANARRCTEKDQ